MNSSSSVLIDMASFFRLYPPIIIIVFAVFGNGLSFIIICQPEIRQLSIFVYLLFQCTFDTLTVLFGCVPIVMSSYQSDSHYKYIDNNNNKENCHQTLIYGLPPSLCNVYQKFCLLFFSDLAIWTLTTLTVERVLLVARPALGRRWIQQRNVYLVMFILLFLSLIKNWPEFVNGKCPANKEAEDNTNFKNNNITDTFIFVLNIYEKSGRVWIDILFYYLIPVIILLICNVFLVRSFHLRLKRVRAHSRLSHLSVNSIDVESHGGTIASQTTSSSVNNNSNVPSQRTSSAATSSVGDAAAAAAGNLADKKQQEKRRKAAFSRLYEKGTKNLNKMIHIMTILFIILVTPSFCWWTINQFRRTTCFLKQITFEWELFIYSVTDVLVYSHHAINFIFFYTNGKIFRRQFLKLFCLESFYQKRKLKRKQQEPTRWNFPLTTTTISTGSVMEVSRF